MAPGSNGNRWKGKKNRMVKGDGGCLAGFSVVFSSLKATLKKKKKTDAGRCFICFSAPTFFVSVIILAHT